MPLFLLEAPNPAVEALPEADPDDLTPRQALELVYRLKELAGQCG